MDDTQKMTWDYLQREAALTPEQLVQFQRYYQMLIAWNEVHNLTAITALEEVVQYHFLDSLAIASYYSFASCSMMADVGAGGGFPVLPLKIKYPAIPVVLIEVIEKKCRFLSQVVHELGLHDVEVVQLDWRTFLRKTAYPELAKPQALFCARASLAPAELVRMFQPSSPYKKAKLVYWASRGWGPTGQEKKFFIKEELYKVGEKERKYLFFGG